MGGVVARELAHTPGEGRMRWIKARIDHAYGHSAAVESQARYRTGLHGLRARIGSRGGERRRGGRGHRGCHDAVHAVQRVYSIHRHSHQQEVAAAVDYLASECAQIVGRCLLTDLYDGSYMCGRVVVGAALSRRGATDCKLRERIKDSGAHIGHRPQCTQNREKEREEAHMCIRS